MPYFDEHLAHRPAELAPLEREHDDRLGRVAEQGIAPPRRAASSRALAPLPAGAGAAGAGRHRSGIPASTATIRFPPRSSRRRRLRTAVWKGSARRYRAACTGCWRPAARPGRPRSAPENVAPAEMPTKMPSCRASSLAQRSASLPSIGTKPSMRLRRRDLLRQPRDEVRRPALHQVRPEQRMARAVRAVAVRWPARCRWPAWPNCPARRR